MSLDFQEIRKQVIKLGQLAPGRWQELEDKRNQVSQHFLDAAQNVDELNRRIQRAISSGGKFRCAVPGEEPIDGHHQSSGLPGQVDIIAADGSQVLPDRHAEVLYYLINIGALHYRLGDSQPPGKFTVSQLRYDRDLYTDWGMIRPEDIALLRDVQEREYLVKVWEDVCANGECGDTVIAMTDGPVELWGVRDARGNEPSLYKRKLEEYLKTLHHMHRLGMVPCGYIDKPRADLVVRMLEISQLDENQLEKVNQVRPYRGVSDMDLFINLLAPGERSSVFRLHSLSAEDFSGELGLHFFYLNVGRINQPWIARVEIPRWVADAPGIIDTLHAVLLQQCAILGGRSYPYLLHRAHEEALVSLDEKKELTQMIINEIRRNGVPVSHISHKQGLKDSGRRTRI